MAIRKMQAEEPSKTVQSIKRVAKAVANGGGTGEYATKEDLKDRLILVTMRDFDPAYKGQYEATARAEVDVIDVETGKEYLGFWAFSNLGSQLGEGLTEGETGLGKIVSGPTRNGKGTWWGFDWSEDDADSERAEAIQSEKIPY
jgi:hypothetical protein